LFAIDLVVHAAHLFFGYFARQRAQRRANFGMFLQRRAANQGHRFVGRKIMTIVLQNGKVQRIDQAIG
jgi:hypothetical protein